MIECIIIDDEPSAREFLKALIEQHFGDRLSVVFIAASVKEGAAAIHKLRPDIVFLDIEMPGENGFKLFDYFEMVKFETIFTTAHKHYAIEAIKHTAMDFLLKPINYIDLSEALLRFEKKILVLKKPDKKITSLLNQLNSHKDNYGKITIPTTNGFQLERINNILYCEAGHNCTLIHTISNETIQASKPIMFFEDLLPAELFFRIHKSTLININHVKRYSRQDGFKVILENGEELEIAIRRNEQFVKLLTQRS